MPDSRGHSRLQAHSAGLFWWLATFGSPVRLSVPKSRNDSSETWLPKIAGLKWIWAFASQDAILNIINRTRVRLSPCFWKAPVGCVPDTFCCQELLTLHLVILRRQVNGVAKVCVTFSVSVPHWYYCKKFSLFFFPQKEELLWLAFYFLPWAWVVDTIESNEARELPFPLSMAHGSIQFTSVENLLCTQGASFF